MLASVEKPTSWQKVARRDQDIDFLQAQVMDVRIIICTFVYKCINQWAITVVEDTRKRARKIAIRSAVRPAQHRSRPNSILREK